MDEPAIGVDQRRRITDELTKPFPPQAIKSRQGGGGSSLSYIEGETVIRRLIAATGNRFDVKVLGVDAKAAGTTKGYNGQPGKPQTLLTATVELCIPGLGCRQHIGVQLTSEGGGEDLAKGAVTDAIKKAATLFGVGLELYGPDYEAGELDPVPARPQPARTPQERPQPATTASPPRQAAIANETVEAEYARRLATAGTLGDLRKIAAEMKDAGVGTDHLRGIFRNRETAFVSAS